MEVFPSMTPWSIGAFTQFEIWRAHVYAHPED